MSKLYFKRYLLTGLLAFIPVWITWVVFKFVFTLMASVGAPVINAVLGLIGLVSPRLELELHRDWLISSLAFVLAIAALYLLGLLSNLVIGRRVLGWIDDMLERIPLVHPVYGGVKKLMTLMRNKPTGTQRVVLIGFPSREMKSVGFVTRVFIDASGREIAAVYVPTTPNPTGGYLELVPTDELIATDWSVDQGMAFLLSGGAVSPDTLPAIAPSPRAADSGVQL